LTRDASEALSPGPASTSRPLPRNVRLLGAASLLNDVASEMIYPLLPTFLLGVLEGGLVSLGVIEGVADSAASLLKLWSGGRSDRVGRRKSFVVLGYALATVSRPLIALITAPWQLLAIRLADRTGKGLRTAPRDALIADSATGMHGRAFGFHRAMDHLGAAIGPLLAYGFLRLWPGRLREMFLLTLLPGLLVVGLLLWGLREAPAATPPRERLRLTLAPLGRDFRLFLLALVVFTLGNSSDAFLLVRAGQLGVPELHLPLLWGAFHIVKSAGSWLLGRAADRVGARPLVLLGWLVYAGVYLAFAWASVAWQAWAFFLVYALFYALAEPAERVLVADLAGSGRKGLAYGWYNCAVGIATLPASLIFGTLYERHGPLAAFGWGAGLALLAAVLLLGVRPGAGRVGQ
jgi:MFS family permease